MLLPERGPGLLVSNLGPYGKTHRPGWKGAEHFGASWPWLSIDTSLLNWNGVEPMKIRCIGWLIMIYDVNWCKLMWMINSDVTFCKLMLFCQLRRSPCPAMAKTRRWRFSSLCCGSVQAAVSSCAVRRARRKRAEPWWTSRQRWNVRCPNNTEVVTRCNTNGSLWFSWSVVVSKSRNLWLTLMPWS